MYTNTSDIRYNTFFERKYNVLKVKIILATSAIQF